MKAYIIGSSLSGIVGIDCQNTECYGLNWAAINHKTKYAFSGHNTILDEFKRLGIKNVIGCDPTFENSSIQNYQTIDSIKQGVPQSVFDLIDQDDKEVKKMIFNAVSGVECAYPNYWTVLHLAIFYLIKKGFKEIDLICCHNDYEKYPTTKYEIEYHRTRAPYMRTHTGKIVELAKDYDIKINWIK